MKAVLAADDKFVYLGVIVQFLRVWRTCNNLPW